MFPVRQRIGRRRCSGGARLSGPLRQLRYEAARRSHPHQHRQDGFIHEQLVTAIAQLAATPLPAKGEAMPLRYVVPPDAPLVLWDSGTPQSPARATPCRRLAASTTYRCGLLPRSIRFQTVPLSEASAFSAPSRAACRLHLSRHSSVAPETVASALHVRSAAGTESASERGGNTSIGIRTKFGREEALLHARLQPHRARSAPHPASPSRFRPRCP